MPLGGIKNNDAVIKETCGNLRFNSIFISISETFEFITFISCNDLLRLNAINLELFSYKIIVAKRSGYLIL